MLISAVALGLVGSILFAIVLIIQVLRGKNAVPALAGFGLCVVMLLCGGYLFSITDGVIPPVEDKPASAQSTTRTSIIATDHQQNKNGPATNNISNSPEPQANNQDVASLKASIEDIAPSDQISKSEAYVQAPESVGNIENVIEPDTSKNNSTNKNISDIPDSKPSTLPSTGSGDGNGSNFNTYDNAEQQDTESKWVLNTSSLKIHYPSCNQVRKIAPQNYLESNKSESELIAEGYTTCGVCHK